MIENVIRNTCDFCNKSIEVISDKEKPLHNLRLPVKYYEDSGSYKKVVVESVDVCTDCLKQLCCDLSEFYNASSVLYAGLNITRIQQHNSKNELISELDSADLFIRDRLAANSMTLNDYDISILEDIAKTCNKVARSIEQDHNIHVHVGDTIYFYESTFGVVLPYIVKTVITELKNNKVEYSYEATCYDNNKNVLDETVFTNDDIGVTIFDNEDYCRKNVKE